MGIALRPTTTQVLILAKPPMNMHQRINFTMDNKRLDSDVNLSS
jgi:hypothetical protein